MIRQRHTSPKSTSSGAADPFEGAKCRAEDPELFFPVGQRDESQRAEAISVCKTCPLIDRCFQYAMDNRINDGVWGGMDMADRLNYIRRINRPNRVRPLAEQIPAGER